MPPLQPRPTPRRTSPDSFPPDARPGLPRVRGPAGPRVGLRELPALRLGALRVSSRQLDLLSAPERRSGGGRCWTSAQRGTRFLELPVRSVLNTAASTQHGLLVDQPLRRLRVRLHLLLRAGHPPLRRRAERRRAPSRCRRGRRSSAASWSRPASPRCWPARSTRPARRHAAGHRHRHRSLPAGRAAIPAHPPDPRGAAAVSRARHRASSPSRRWSPATSTCCGGSPSGTR